MLPQLGFLSPCAAPTPTPTPVVVVLGPSAPLHRAGQGAGALRL